MLSLNKCPSLTYEYIYILILNVLGAIIILHLHIQLTTTDPISRPTVSLSGDWPPHSNYKKNLALKAVLAGRLSMLIVHEHWHSMWWRTERAAWTG